MDNFANEFMTKLDGKLSPEQMKTVLMELEMFSAEYNIEKKSTEIVTYDMTIRFRNAIKSILFQKR